MKTVSGRKGDQQEQLCQIDLGNQCNVVGKLFKGQMLIHVRTYDRRDDWALFPPEMESLKILKSGRNFNIVFKKMLTVPLANTRILSRLTCLYTWVEIITFL